MAFGSERETAKHARSERKGGKESGSAGEKGEREKEGEGGKEKGVGI